MNFRNKRFDRGLFWTVSNNSLEHYGILGMKWGIRRTPEELGHRNLKNAKVSNIEKWGKSPETNTLYIAGYSGSGKSTTALSIARSNDQVIHLDLYSDEVSSGAGSRNKTFESYLDKRVPNWKEISKEDSKIFKRFSKEYWKMVDDFSETIDAFSKEQYRKGNRVIVEGVQIADGWLKPDVASYSGQPVAVMGTNKIASLLQALSRDERTDYLAAIKGVLSTEESQWSKAMDTKLDELSKGIGAKKDKKTVDDFLKKYGQRRLK